jgi:hypothetical protein
MNDNILDPGEGHEIRDESATRMQRLTNVRPRLLFFARLHRTRLRLRACIEKGWLKE